MLGYCKYYAIRLISKGPRVACKVVYSFPLDPITNEELDRSPRWIVEINSSIVDPASVIIEHDGVSGEPVIKGEEINEDEYNHLLEVRAWALKHDPYAPEASPRTPIDLHTQPPVF